MATKNVLIVDDSEMMRQITRRVLETLPVTIIEAPGPKDGVQILLQGSVDALVTNWNMRGLDGLEFTRFLSSLAPFERLPSMLLSKQYSEPARLEALKAGVDVFMPKCAPFELWQDGVSRLLAG